MRRLNTINNSITIQELAQVLVNEHPSWSADAVMKQAKEYLSCIDLRLNEVVKAYVKDNKMIDYQYGEFSIYLIRALRHNCSFFQAIILMDAYLKDPMNGKALILRRG